jgi:hypothetical protein
VNDQPSFTLAAGLAPITSTGTAQTIAGVIAGTDFGPSDEDPGGAHAVDDTTSSPSQIQ